jgi:Mitotic checkpoint regulator, MAD2B-interacting
MVLVSYSDSEGSEDEKPQPQAKKDTHTSTTKPDTKFTVDKANPRKIRVNLQDIKNDFITNGDVDGEPAPKRPRIGGGFSGFNSMLPAPKKNTQSTNGSTTASGGTARKVFSLKTGAEPGFSREADAELKQLFAEQSTNPVGVSGNREDGRTQAPDADRVLASPSASQLTPPKQGNAMMFKPLSVARNTQKKKKPPGKSTAATAASGANINETAPALGESAAPASRVNLFSIGGRDEPPDAPPAPDTDYKPLVYQATEKDDSLGSVAKYTEDVSAELNDPTPSITAETEMQSLDSIAADLNLSASAKRQLLGRNHKNASKVSSSIINFNTDQEYAANEVLRISGEQVQHNPVRAIAPGKHSLKQLVSAASGQKEALEESFASGRRNKKEAGGRYGW